MLKSSMKLRKSSFSSSLGSSPTSIFFTSAAHRANSGCLLRGVKEGQLLCRLMMACMTRFLERSGLY